ncbi:MAG: hypothetical protein ACT4PM_13695 [Gemmatimonadales bacterium]
MTWWLGTRHSAPGARYSALGTQRSAGGPRRPVLFALFVLFALSTLFAPASAQVGIAARASTLGLGAELSVHAGPHVVFRLGGNYFELSRDVSIESNRYLATPHFENGVALVDLYPFKGIFHLSGGIILNYNEGRLAAYPPVTLDGRTYSESEVSALDATVTFDRTAPYLGIGIAGRSRVAFVIDLGVGFTGTPLVDLQAASELNGAEREELDARVEREEEQVRDEITRRPWLRYHPVVSVGIKLGF